MNGAKRLRIANKFIFNSSKRLTFNAVKIPFHPIHFVYHR